MKQLPPFRLKPEYWRSIEQEIVRILESLLFTPLRKELKISKRELTNNKSALYEAVASGRVWYADGRFQGDFNSAITKDLREIGATYNRREKSWSLEASALPAQIRMANAAASVAFDDLRGRLVRTLDSVDIDSIAGMKEKYAETIKWMGGDFKKALKHVAFVPEMTEAQEELIASQWGENLELYIRDFTNEEILKLRRKIQENSFAGQRAENIVKLIRKEYGVSLRKAKFLAKQETSLLASKFRESRYRDAGSVKYRWITSGSHRVRDDHKALNNTIQFWDSPPVTDTRTGARNHPGEDFNCECTAIAIIE